MKNLSLILCLCISVLTGYSQTKSTQVSKGQKIDNSLTADEVHNYSITLDSAYYVYGKAMQKSVDVVVKVLNPNGELVGSFDGPAAGPENFHLITESTGTYTFEVSSFEDLEGDYSFEVLVSEPLATEPGKRVDQLMTPYSGKNVPGAAALVMKDGNVIFSRAYGMANLTYDIPFETNTPTNIGSTSKQFTAFAILLLAEQGKLSLDDDIRKYFPELPDFDQKVTIRNLLTHTSGYREFLNTLAMTGRDLGSSLDRSILIKMLERQPALQNEPGNKWNYNNTGFALLADLVEKVTDTPFPEWMEENVFEPLNMNNSLVRGNQNQVVPNRSTGYGINKNGNYEELQDLGGAMGAGGIYASIDDLAKWVRNFEDPKVGNQALIQEMTTPYVLKSGDTTNYGLGLFIVDYKGLKQIQHGGADVAHRSMLMYFPEIDAAVITESNFAGFDGSMANQIADIFFEDYLTEADNEPEKDAESDFEYNSEDFETLTGRYEMEEAPGFVITFQRDGDRLFAQATGQPEFEIKALSDSLFSVVGVDAKLTFHLNENGSADSLTLHQNGDHLAKKLSWKPEKEDLEAYTGKYFSEEIETMYSISIDEGKLVMENFQIADKLKLEPVEEDSFGSEFPISEVVFKRNEEGQITGFSASNGRTLQVFFKKMN
ncbi:serine hydrolase [Gramella sp. BOM4]|nr:serine hydrolase [Christiangramia bathymodioli]